VFFDLAETITTCAPLLRDKDLFFSAAFVTSPCLHTSFFLWLTHVPDVLFLASIAHGNGHWRGFSIDLCSDLTVLFCAIMLLTITHLSMRADLLGSANVFSWLLEVDASRTKNEN
jgi:hypothetical protein